MMDETFAEFNDNDGLVRFLGFLFRPGFGYMGSSWRAYHFFLVSFFFFFLLTGLISLSFFFLI